jgi:hypothetical protein
MMLSSANMVLERCIKRARLATTSEPKLALTFAPGNCIGASSMVDRSRRAR